MSTYTTETEDREGTDEGTQQGEQSRAQRVRSTVGRAARNGTLPIAAGGLLLIRALRSSGGRGRTAAQGLLGAGLIALGVRRRRSDDEGSADQEWGTETDDQESAEAAAHLEQQRVLQQDEQNPRGTSGEPDVETQTDPESGNVRFHEDQDLDPENEPHYEEGSPEDPRLDDDTADDDDPIDVDLSEAAMADEASEAAGPSPEQAQPASTEGTEPEPTPEEDASHMQADKGRGRDEDEGDDETADEEAATGWGEADQSEEDDADAESEAEEERTSGDEADEA